jgi:uncharacterized protein (TIGR03083 family)
VGRTESGGTPLTEWGPAPALAAYYAGVLVICELAGQFTEEQWALPTPCPEWRAVDLAAHLRCVADDYHEYLDEAPRSRLARLMSTGPVAERLARKLARQNAAEMAALPDDGGPEHISAFTMSARAYAQRVWPVWDLPHHRYRDDVVTVGGMVGVACVEWHVHAWDLARAIGKDYQPADPEILLAAWQAGMPHLPMQAVAQMATCGAAGQGQSGPASSAHLSRPPAGDSWRRVLRASGRLP